MVLINILCTFYLKLISILFLITQNEYDTPLYLFFEFFYYGKKLLITVVNGKFKLIILMPISFVKVKNFPHINLKKNSITKWVILYYMHNLLRYFFVSWAQNSPTAKYCRQYQFYFLRS